MAKIYFLEDMLLIPRYFFCVLFFFCSNCGVSQANILVSTRSCATPLTKNPMFYIVSKQVNIKYHNFFIIIITMAVRVSLCAPRLIPRALKLTTM
jgi:hypothetical protein